jgi:phage shock protein PspC (stress-responsive transcriptional regulator)
MNGFFAAIRRTGVVRSSDRWFGGVAGGLARRFGIDPLLARGLIGVTMLMGFGLVLYGIAWALLPEESDGRIHLEETIAGRFDIALLGAVAVFVLGMSAGDWWFSWGPFDSGWLGGLAWVALIVAGAVILVNALRRPDGGRPATPAWQPPYPEGQAPMSSPTDPAAAPPAHPYPAPPRATAYPAGPAPAAPAPSPAAPGTPSGAAPGATAWSAAPAAPRGWTPQPPPPPRPVKPPKPPKPPRRGPGAALTGVVVGVILLGLAVLLLAERSGDYGGPVASVVLGGGLLLVGLGIIVSGLRGRTGGGLTALAIVGLVLAGPFTAVDRGGPDWNWDRGSAVRSIDSRVTSRDAAEAGYRFGVGDATVDLTGVPLTDETLRVPISGGLGDVTVVVPRGAAVSADVTSGAGTVEWRVDGKRQRSDGVGHDRRYTSDAMADGRDAEIALSVEVGVGSITIEEA